MDIQLLAAVSLSFLPTVLCSRGDRSYVYHACMNHCKDRLQCTNESSKVDHPLFSTSLSPAKPWDSWPKWRCVRECSYYCMWNAVWAFKEDGAPVPQFHGRWPFVRLLGIQEPASALFSFLNLLAHLIMIHRFCATVPKTAPMRNLWLVYSLFACNAWISSTIFHTYDNLITEKMDYFGALAFLLSSFFMAIVRVFHYDSAVLKPPALWFLGVSMVLFFLCHTSYLSLVRFDYGYNMAVNVTVGVLNGGLWIFWCLPKWNLLPHSRPCFAVILVMQALVLLELYDFPPVLWTFDAHAIWHGGTVALAFLWYRFVIDDCIFLLDSHRYSFAAMKSVKIN